MLSDELDSTVVGKVVVVVAVDEISAVIKRSKMSTVRTQLPACEAFINIINLIYLMK